MKNQEGDPDVWVILSLFWWILVSATAVKTSSPTIPPRWACPVILLQVPETSNTPAVVVVVKCAEWERDTASSPQIRSTFATCRRSNAQGDGIACAIPRGMT
ncbi:hypothetical protein FA13DRAFT_1739762 [Coprinellus micaceus]|uniref:Secreted protein n=1 Tax=Coprinellus micaceus TaxID=71717 RepID=A0A4Y7SPH4_COPMI|nr:hypothetical protein FA13DRAFT_1739762 [Coprinellus micaceus]